MTIPKKQKVNCSIKTRFSDEFAARAGAIRQMKFVGPLWVYKCPVCRGWHMTKWKGPARMAANFYEEDNKI